MTCQSGTYGLWYLLKVRGQRSQACIKKYRFKIFDILDRKKTQINFRNQLNLINHE